MSRVTGFLGITFCKQKRPASKDVSSLFSIQSVQSVSVAAKEHGVKIEDLHAQLTGPAGLPQIPNLTEEIAKMELQVACLAGEHAAHM